MNTGVEQLLQSCKLPEYFLPLYLPPRRKNKETKPLHKRWVDWLDTGAEVETAKHSLFISPTEEKGQWALSSDQQRPSEGILRV